MALRVRAAIAWSSCRQGQRTQQLAQLGVGEEQNSLDQDDGGGAHQHALRLPVLAADLRTGKRGEQITMAGVWTDPTARQKQGPPSARARVCVDGWGLHAFPSKYHKEWPSNYKGFPSPLLISQGMALQLQGISLPPF